MRCAGPDLFPSKGKILYEGTGRHHETLEMILLGDVCFRTVNMRWKHRGGSGDGVPMERPLPGAQFSCELLRLTHDECLTIFMPGYVDEVTDVANIGARDGHCELVCIEV